MCGARAFAPTHSIFRAFALIYVIRSTEKSEPDQGKNHTIVYIVELTVPSYNYHAQYAVCMTMILITILIDVHRSNFHQDRRHYGTFKIIEMHIARRSDAHCYAMEGKSSKAWICAQMRVALALYLNSILIHSRSTCPLRARPIDWLRSGGSIPFP